MVAQAPFDRRALSADGFTGFISVSDLLAGRIAEVPDRHGVYAVLREETVQPSFLAKSPAGQYKGRDATVAVEVLAARWVVGTPLLYFGRARKSPTRPNRSGLRHRLGR